MQPAAQKRGYILSYIRNKQNRRIGCIVAVKHENSISVGFSALHHKDSFNKDIALDIALGRAYNPQKFERHLNEKTLYIPTRVVEFLNKDSEKPNNFKNRIIKYFRCSENELPEWVKNAKNYIYKPIEESSEY